MADKGILFSAPMVRALWDGRKTQTRRALTVQPPEPCTFAGFYSVPLSGAFQCRFQGETTMHTQRLPYAPGDRLWVREAWRASKDYDAYPPREISPWPVHYEADGKPDPRDELGMNGRYRHARFMPRWASRLTLIVTDVRVQRLQEISTDDVIAEGVSLPWVQGGTLAMMAQGIAKDGYRSLWNSLHGPDAWDANPWVVALTFTVHRQNIDQMEKARG